MLPFWLMLRLMGSHKLSFAEASESPCTIDLATCDFPDTTDLDLAMNPFCFVLTGPREMDADVTEVRVCLELLDSCLCKCCK